MKTDIPVNTQKGVCLLEQVFIYYIKKNPSVFMAKVYYKSFSSDFLYSKPLLFFTLCSHSLLTLEKPS